MNQRIRYKLARIRNGYYLSANSLHTKPFGDYCLEYKAGEITSVKGKGIACYKTKEQAIAPAHIEETMHNFNHGEPIALLKLEPIGGFVFSAVNYKKGLCYEGGINYRSVRVLEVTRLR